MIFCQHEWHTKRDADWCPTCGDRFDGVPTIANATMMLLMMGPLHVRNRFTEEEREIRWKETNGYGSVFTGFYADPDAPRRIEHLEMQAWEVLGVAERIVG